jgi:hypothetical protein
MKRDKNEFEDIPPPGIIRASHLPRSSGIRTRMISNLVLNASLSNAVLCSTKAPWRAVVKTAQI